MSVLDPQQLHMVRSLEARAVAIEPEYWPLKDGLVWTVQLISTLHRTRGWSGPLTEAEFADIDALCADDYSPPHNVLQEALRRALAHLQALTR